MSFWFNDPQLFLYVKGTGPDDVILRRCKVPVSSSSSSLVVPMKSEDFEYVETVKNHLELIDEQFDWDETDYKRLVKYIHERLLLVNRQGLVITEIYKLDDPNRVPIYIRSLDVLPLKPYIPNIKERLIPSRTVKYLEDVNGKAAAMMELKDSNEIIKLTARVENLEAENTRLESKNNTLDTSVTQLTAGLATTTDNVADLQSKNIILEAENKKMTADLLTQMTALTILQQEVKNMNANSKEAWMNDLTNSEWVGIEGFKSGGPYDITFVGQQGTYTVDDNNTNVRARYWYKAKLNAWDNEYKLVVLEDLTPNKERARFSQGKWTLFITNGKTCLCSRF